MIPVRRWVCSLALLATVTACGSASTPGSPTTSGAASQPSSAASSEASSSADSSSTAPETSPSATEGVEDSDFDHHVEFDNGVSVGVDTLDATRNGPDAKPMVTFEIEIANKSSDPLTGSDATVGLTYGKNETTATAVSGAKGLSTFSGVIAAGQTVKATYGFSVPRADQGNVQLTVLISDGYDPVVFKGSAK